MPWHRVRYVKAGDLVVWDRHARIDLVFGTGDTPAADLAAIAAPRPATPPPAPAAARPQAARRAAFDPAACLRFDPAAGAWVPAGPAGDVRAERGAGRHVQRAVRRVRPRPHLPRPAGPCLRRGPGGLGADVVALHEATPALWDALLAAAWVRAGYPTVSAGPDPEPRATAPSCCRGGRSRSRCTGSARTSGRSWAGCRLNGRRARVRRRASHQRPHRRRRAAPRAPAARHRRAARPRRPRRRRRARRPQLRRRHPARRRRVHRPVAAALHPHDAGFTFDPVVNPLSRRSPR